MKIIEGKRILDIWNDLASKLTIITKSVAQARIARILELAQRNETNTIQTKLKLVDRNQSHCISLENLELTDMDYHVFQLLKIVLRNSSFKSISDGVEFISQRLHFLRKTTQLTTEYRSVPAAYSRTFCTTKLLPVLSEAAKLMLKNKLKNVCLGSTLTDGWSSVTHDRFLGLSFQYVNWTVMQIQNELILFEHHQAAHTSMNLAQTYQVALETFFEDGLLLANHTTDNAANERLTAHMLLEAKGFFKEAASCMAHTIQLDLADFFKSIETILRPILKYNSRLSNSPSLSKEFNDFQIAVGATPALAACTSVKTRWWSMIPSLSFYVRRRDCIVSFFQTKIPSLLSIISQKIGRDISEPPSLAVASELLQYLNKINAIQSTLSAEDTVTSTKVLSSIEEIKALQYPVPFHFPRLTEIFGKLTIWSKAAFFDPSGILILERTNLLEPVKLQLETDLQKLTKADDTNPFQMGQDYRSILNVIDVSIRQQQAQHFDCLRYYSETILPLLARKSREQAEALQKLLSLLFSAPATQVACERVFSKASKAVSSKGGTLGAVSLSNIVCIQKAFPNTVDGVLKALNAVRELGTQSLAAEN